MDKSFEVTFLGTNGSCSFNNGKRQKYGTNTPCVAVKAGSTILIFDAGSGICNLRYLTDYQKSHFHLFFSHYHMDHIDGMLFCAELFDPSNNFAIYGSGDVKKEISNIISPPLCPVGIEAFRAEICYHSIDSGELIMLPDDVKVRSYNLSHPGKALGYRVDYCGKSFCYCDDVELTVHQNDAGLIEFTGNVDLLVMDSAFTDGNVIPGWGHSSPGECVKWAKQVNAKHLALYHYNFLMTDDEIDDMEEKAKIIFPNTFTAYDNMKVIL